MIVDIPNEKEFFQAGIDYFNMAWDSAIDIFTTIVEFSETMDDVGYLRSSQRKLESSLALVQQGVELILKGKIVEISPYLLIANKPDSWPKGCAQNDTRFAEFRTIDAQDLVKVVNSVHSEKLSPNFIQLFNSLRVKRNQVMHSVGSAETLQPIEVIEQILELSSYLIPQKSWLHLRRCYQDNQFDNYLTELNYQDKEMEAFGLGNLQMEISYLLDALSPSMVKKHFDFDKKKSRFLCANCHELRLNEAFYKLRDEELLHLKSAYWLDRANGKALCLYCREKASEYIEE
nr:hypothetical protein [uncultured Vibrio sp.]